MEMSHLRMAPGTHRSARAPSDSFAFTKNVPQDSLQQDLLSYVSTVSISLRRSARMSGIVAVPPPLSPAAPQA
eukprot:9142655-Pyramimonas_sp.AAC.1